MKKRPTVASGALSNAQGWGGLRAELLGANYQRSRTFKGRALDLLPEVGIHVECGERLGNDGLRAAVAVRSLGLVLAVRVADDAGHRALVLVLDAERFTDFQAIERVRRRRSASTGLALGNGSQLERAGDNRFNARCGRGFGRRGGRWGSLQSRVGDVGLAGECDGEGSGSERDNLSHVMSPWLSKCRDRCSASANLQGGQV